MSRDMEIDVFMGRHRPGVGVGPLAADASFRRYLRTDGRPSEVLMDAPPDKEDVRPFMAIGQFLNDRGFSAPRLLAADIENGFLLLEDLGDDTFTELLETGAGPAEAELYRSAVDLLLALHGQDVPEDLPITGANPYRLPRYDDGLLLEETNLFTDWYLAKGLQTRFSTGARADWEALWKALFPAMRVGGETLVLRDYHADNLMWLPGRAGLARVGLLDFQDGVLGPPAYDLVSLLQDCRRVVSEDMEAGFLSYYLDRRPELDGDAFRRSYTLLGLQRNIKIIGIFTRLWKRDGKPFYPSRVPRVWDLVERDLQAPCLEGLAPLADLRDWLDFHVPTEQRHSLLPGLPKAARGEHA